MRMEETILLYLVTGLAVGAALAWRDPRRAAVWLTLGVGSVGFGGLFAVVSYITPTLTELTGLEARQVPLVLAVLGVGMILGNLVGSWLADRSLTRTIGAVLIWNIVVLSLFSVVVRSAWAAVPTVLLIGSGVALVPAHVCTCVNLSDELVCHRRGEVQAVWPVVARGKRT